MFKSIANRASAFLRNATTSRRATPRSTPPQPVTPEAKRYTVWLRSEGGNYVREPATHEQMLAYVRGDPAWRSRE